MHSQQQFSIRNATKEEIKLFIQWGIKQDWNQGKYDYKIFYEADPNGFFVGELKGEIITIISAVKYQNNTGFISFYITKPEFRGKGYGKKLFIHAMKYLQGVNVGMDGDESVAAIYQKWGYRAFFKTMVMSGYIQMKDSQDPSIVPINQIPIQKILAYQRTVCPFVRDDFLQYYLKTPESLAVGYIKDGQLKGYGLIRKIYNKYRVGPLYGDTLQIAENLLARLVNFPKQKTEIILNVHDMNPDSLQLCEEHGMKSCYNAVRMYTHEMPSLQYDKIYSILSPDIG